MCGYRAQSVQSRRKCRWNTSTFWWTASVTLLVASCSAGSRKTEISEQEPLHQERKSTLVTPLTLVSSLTSTRVSDGWSGVLVLCYVCCCRGPPPSNCRLKTCIQASVYIVMTLEVRKINISASCNQSRPKLEHTHRSVGYNVDEMLGAIGPVGAKWRTQTIPGKPVFLSARQCITLSTADYKETW